MLDQVSAAEALAKAGMDTRQWVSYGTVDRERTVAGERVDPVIFDPELGPLVNVTLQPSGLPVRCRVAASAAGAVGNGEAEYSPFVAGDEVVVLIPEGEESADCVIVGRLNNALDRFPENVGGQDPSNNRFAFRRRRTPFVEEFATTWMTRVASHGGFFLISESGAITIRDGAKGALQMGPDIFGFTEGLGETVAGDDTAVPNPTALFQLDLVNRRMTLQMDDAQFMLSSSSGSSEDGPPPGEANLSLPGALTVAFGNNQPAEHVATIEAVAALIEVGLAGVGGGFGVPAVLALQTAVAAGGAVVTPLMGAALAAGLPLAAATAKPPAPTTGPTAGVQLAPKLGAVNFKTG